jgi:HK97 family phage prohead protease
MNGLFKTKDIALELKDMQMAKGLVTMYVSAFGNKDAHGDIIEKGAYKKTIQENKHRIKHLFQHDINNIIGRPVEMVEDNTGLLVTSFVSDLKNGDYRKMYEDGLITEHSVGIIPVKEAYDETRKANVMRELRLFEFSSVTFGANENTPVVDIKSMSRENKKTLFDKFEKLMKAMKSSSYTDSTFELMEIELERIKSLIINSEPQESTQENNEPIDFDINNYFKSLQKD